MKSKLISLVISAVISLSAVSPALAGNASANPKPNLFAGLWSNFKGTASLIIKSIYAPFFSPPVVVKPANPEKTMFGVAKSGQSQGPLYIPGKFGFGGTGGLIPNPPLADPAKSKDTSLNLSNIGNPQKPVGDKDINPNPIKPYPTPQPPIPYPKPIVPDTTFQKQVNSVGAKILPSAPLPTPAKTQSVPPTTSSNTTRSNALELVIMTTANLAEPIKEGSQIKFFANLKLSNGGFKDVSQSVNWSVVGDIGSINYAGFFTAGLGYSVSEYGAGAGSVIADYSGVEGRFLGKSQIFKVIGAVDDSRNDIGGQ